jgi:hypothetical protein
MAEPAFDPRLAPKIRLTDADRASINADINKVAMKLRERASNSGASIASTISSPTRIPSASTSCATTGRRCLTPRRGRRARDRFHRHARRRQLER